MALLGSDKFPAIVRVRSVRAAADALATLHMLRAAAIVLVAPNRPEDRSDLEALIRFGAPKPSGKREGNASCVCGSGKKYKACCQRQVDDARVLGRRAENPHGLPAGVVVSRSLTERSPAERAQAQMHRAIAASPFDRPEDVEAYLERHRAADTLSTFGPETPQDEAQELVYDAWVAESDARRASLAEQALAIDPDCADALLVLAEARPGSPEGALSLRERALQAAERSLGAEHLRAAAGHFWNDMATRPYMRARSALARSLWAVDRREEAVAALLTLLRLNPGDNQGVRYWLAPWLIALGRGREALALMRPFAPDSRVDAIYAAALAVFSLEGPTPFAVRLLAEALVENAGAVAYLLGEQALPDRLPDAAAPGEDNEAIACAMLQGDAWRAVPGALDWLKGALA